MWRHSSIKRLVTAPPARCHHRAAAASNFPLPPPSCSSSSSAVPGCRQFSSFQRRGNQQSGLLARFPSNTANGRATNKSPFGQFAPQRRGIFVISENTPNPESKMFYPQGKDVLGASAKTKTFSDKFQAKDSLLASSLFRVQGVHNVMLAPRHVTVTKEVDADWTFLKPNVELVMSQFFAANLDVCDPKSVEYINEPKPPSDKKSASAGSEDEMIQEILDLLEERVKPFVQQDGGDVEFDRIEDSVVYLKMQGACSGCPKSGITLNIQIKQLIQHYFPDIVDVREAIDPDDEHIPRPGDNQSSREFGP